MAFNVGSGLSCGSAPNTAPPRGIYECTPAKCTGVMMVAAKRAAPPWRGRRPASVRQDGRQSQRTAPSPNRGAKMGVLHWAQASSVKAALCIQPRRVDWRSRVETQQRVSHSGRTPSGMLCKRTPLGAKRITLSAR